MHLPLSPLRFLSLCAAVLSPSLALAGPAVDAVVVFNEIMYHPTDAVEAGEFIELHNQMGINVDLSDWALAGGINYTFPDGTVIPGGGYLVVAKTPALFPGSLGPWTGSLSNAGERVRLRDKNQRLLDEISYTDSGNWPLAADGGGFSMAKPNEDTSSLDAAHWTVSQQPGGTPGTANFPPPPPTVSATVISLQTPWKYNNAGTDPGSTWKDASYDDTAWPTGTALFDFGNTTIYDPYPGGPPAVSGNAEITGVTIAGKSSEFITSGLLRYAVACINGAGLAANGTHTTTAPNNMWMSTGTTSDPYPVDITFDLGATQNITKLHIWNYNESTTTTNRGAKTVEIFVASTVGGALTSAGTFTFPQASGLVMACVR
jgi:hypothetical protein